MKSKTQKQTEAKIKSAVSNDQRNEVQLNDLKAKKGEEIKGGVFRRTI
jgi:hypothetical protein